MTTNTHGTQRLDRRMVRMRIAYYMTQILEHGGGLEKYLIETARDLSEFPGVRVDVFTMDDAFNLSYGRWHSFYFFKKFDPRLLYREPFDSIHTKLGKAQYFKCRSCEDLTRRIREYDIVYSRNEITEAFLFKRALGYRNVPPVIFGCHTPHFYPIADRFHARLHNWLYTSRLYTWLANGVSAFHVVNNQSWRLLTSQFPEKRIVKIYYPFDFEAFAARADKFAAPQRLAADTFNILWAGRLTEQKGVRDLVHLVNEVNRHYADRVAWNICGDGELKPLVLACQDQWRNVTCLGHVNNQYMANYYRQANLFITTSQWESYPYNLLESQALGLPAVAYDISGCNDIIDHGVNGFLAKDFAEFQDKVMFFINGNRLEADVAAYIRKKTDRWKIYEALLNLFELVRG